MDECPLYTEPALYDLLFPNAGGALSGGDERAQRLVASERFYLEAAKEAEGRVLELGCGSGRLTIPIALQGSEIVGVDLSPAMLEPLGPKPQRWESRCNGWPATCVGLACQDRSPRS